MKQFFTIMLAFLLTSCSQIYTNRETDKEAGEKIPKKFYWEIRYGGAQDNLLKLFGDEFFEATSKDKFLESIGVAENKIGPIQEYNLVKWETLIVKGSNAKSEYLFVYDLKRGTNKTQETFSLKKDENGDIKIIGYRVNQDLMNP